MRAVQAVFLRLQMAASCDQASQRLSPGQSDIANRQPPAFVPHPLLRGAHAQTLVSYFVPRRCRLPQPEKRLVRVADAVQVMCLCHWQRGRERTPTLILVHGLEGSVSSQYMIGTANKAWTAGMNVVRMNVRNCGGTEALGPTLYHSGMSEDVGMVVKCLVAEERLEHIVLAGYSMGGNQVLKLVGEWGRDGTTPSQLRAIAAVCPAMDLAPSAQALHLPWNRVYEWWFLGSLRARLRRKCRLYPDHYHIAKWRWKSLWEFDDCITAPHFGFADAADYYQQASASRMVEWIGVPALIIHAEDDPFVRISPETRKKLAANASIRFLPTRRGGHCGFLGAKVGAYGDRRWAEDRVVEYVSRFSFHVSR